MEVYQTGALAPIAAPQTPPAPLAPEVHRAPELAPEAGGTASAATTVPDQAQLGGGQESDLGNMTNLAVFEDLQRKLNQAARGEQVDLTMLDLKPAPKRPGPQAGGSTPAVDQQLTDAVLEAGGNPDELSDDDWSRIRQGAPIVNHWRELYGPEWSSPKNASGRAGDPLIFDLNRDGDTDATADQHGIDVDGLKATKWAERGDGVLAFGDAPLDTEGGKYQDAYANLRDKALSAGIDVSKGYLDTGDLQLLEAQGLTMLVSNGDGTNTSQTPSELGISRMSLGGKAVDQRDVAGNQITTQGSFTRNGQEQLVNDMWLNEI